MFLSHVHILVLSHIDDNLSHPDVVVVDETLLLLLLQVCTSWSPRAPWWWSSGSSDAAEPSRSRRACWDWWVTVCVSEGRSRAASIRTMSFCSGQLVIQKLWYQWTVGNSCVLLLLQFFLFLLLTLRRGGGCWDLGPLQQRPGTHTHVFISLLLVRLWFQTIGINGFLCVSGGGGRHRVL